MHKPPKQSVVVELIVFIFYKQIRYLRNDKIKKLRGKWLNFDFIPPEDNPINLKEFHVFMTTMTLIHGF